MKLDNVFLRSVLVPGIVAFPAIMPLHAQVTTPQIEQALRQTQSEINRQRQPQGLPEPKDIDFLVKPDKNAAAKEGAAASPVDLTKVRVVGSTYLTEQQISAIFKPLQRTAVGLSDLQKVADQIQTIYQDAGYFLTRVYVPLQQAQNASVEIKVVEDTVSALAMLGGTPALRLKVQDIVKTQLSGKKFFTSEDYKKIQAAIKDLDVSGTTVQMKQGKQLGDFELVVTFVEPQQPKKELQTPADKLPPLTLNGLPALPTLSALTKIDKQQPVERIALQTAPQRIEMATPETRDYEIYIQQTDKTPVAKAVDELQFDLAGVRVKGSTYYTNDQLNAMFANLVGKKVTISDLRGVAEQLENQYRESGFFLTRVFLPPQQVKNGIFEIQVIEGYVSAGFAEGGNDITRERMEGLLNNSLAGKKPLSLEALERTLLIANEFPGYAATSMLRQGTELGSSELVATMVDLPDSQSIAINNHSSNVTGPWGFSYNGTFNNKLGRGEQVSLGLNVGSSFDVLKALNLRYTEPLGSSGLIGSVGVLLSDAHPGGSVESSKISSLGSSFTPRLRYPLMRSRDYSVYLESGLAFNKTETKINDLPFRLDELTVWDINTTWMYKTQNIGAGNLRLGASHGLGVSDAMLADPTKASVSGFESRFVKWTYGAQHTFPIAGSYSLLVAFNGQYSNNNARLLSGEEISFGGASVGRGYDNGSISGDTGVGGLIELRYDMAYRHPNLLAPIQVYVFADAAEAIKNALGTDTPLVYKALLSHGFGARLVMSRNISLDLQFANAVHFTPGPDTRPNPRITLTGSMSF